MAEITERQLAEIAANVLDKSELLVMSSKLVLQSNPDTDPNVVRVMENLMDALMIVARMNARATAHGLFIADLNAGLVAKIHEIIDKI